jgi:hypothetical protein
MIASSANGDLMLGLKNPSVVKQAKDYIRVNGDRIGVDAGVIDNLVKRIDDDVSAVASGESSSAEIIRSSVTTLQSQLRGLFRVEGNLEEGILKLTESERALFYSAYDIGLGLIMNGEYDMSRIMMSATNGMAKYSQRITAPGEPQIYPTVNLIGDLGEKMGKDDRYPKEVNMFIEDFGPAVYDRAARSLTTYDPTLGVIHTVYGDEAVAKMIADAYRFNEGIEAAMAAFDAVIEEGATIQSADMLSARKTFGSAGASAVNRLSRMAEGLESHEASRLINERVGAEDLAKEERRKAGLSDLLFSGGQ